MVIVNTDCGVINGDMDSPVLLLHHALYLPHISRYRSDEWHMHVSNVCRKLDMSSLVATYHCLLSNWAIVA